jgi:hypothetical protein
VDPQTVVDIPTLDIPKLRTEVVGLCDHPNRYRPLSMNRSEKAGGLIA